MLDSIEVCSYHSTIETSKGVKEMAKKETKREFDKRIYFVAVAANRKLTDVETANAWYKLNNASKMTMEDALNKFAEFVKE